MNPSINVSSQYEAIGIKDSFGLDIALKQENVARTIQSKQTRAIALSILGFITFSAIAFGCFYAIPLVLSAGALGIVLAAVAGVFGQVFAVSAIGVPIYTHIKAKTTRQEIARIRRYIKQQVDEWKRIAKDKKKRQAHMISIKSSSDLPIFPGGVLAIVDGYLD
jgi:hypothetical protein